MSCDVAVPVPLGSGERHRLEHGSQLGCRHGGRPGRQRGVRSSADPCGATGDLADRPQEEVPRHHAEQARAAARPVLEAVGIDPADAVVRADQPLAVVTADPTVGDLPTYGLATSLTVFGQRVSAAGGWLGGTAKGATYPVISARAAWKQLGNTPFARPLIGCPEPSPAGRDPLICGGPITVTGARFGLSLHDEGNRRVLVPSWLFERARLRHRALRSWRWTRAIWRPRRWRPAATSPVRAAPGRAASPGTVVPPVGPSTAPGTEDPASPESRFSSVKPDGSGGLVVAFTGGVDTCFSYTVVPTETDRRVSLALVEKTTSDEGVRRYGSGVRAARAARQAAGHPPGGRRRDRGRPARPLALAAPRPALKSPGHDDGRAPWWEPARSWSGELSVMLSSELIVLRSSYSRSVVPLS